MSPEVTTPTFRAIWWAMGLISYALQCPLSCVESLSLIFLLLLSLLVLLGRGRSPVPAWQMAFCGVATTVVAWVLRDRQYLLGDGRLWIDWAHTYGLSMPIYNELAATRLFGLVGEIARDKGLIEGTLGAVAIVCGLLSAFGIGAILAKIPPGSAASTCSPELLSAAFVFLQPLSFVFYGHIESYPLFAAALVAFLLVLQRDLATGPPGARTCIACLLLCGFHTMGALLVAPLAAVWIRSHGGSVLKALGLYAGVFLLGLILVAVIPEFRDFTVLENKWSLHLSWPYLIGVTNAWCVILLVPSLVLISIGRKAVPETSLELFLALALVAYLILPLGVTLTLGAYSDLDLLTPAFILASCYSAVKFRAASTMGWRAMCLRLLPGSIFLAAWLTIARCPAGPQMFGDELQAGGLPIAGKVYCIEILAYYLRDHGDAPGAMGKLENALQLSPGSKRLWGPIGELKVQMGDTTSAIGCFSRAIESQKGERFLARYAELLARHGQGSRAVLVLEQDRPGTLKDGARAAVLAAAYLQVGRPDSSFAVSLGRILVTPKDDVAHYNAGAALIRLGKIHEALEEFKRAASIAPKKTIHRVRVAQLLLAAEGPDAAMQYVSSLPTDVKHEVSKQLGLSYK